MPGTAKALLSVSPRPDWDVPGLSRALDRYADGCLEQTTASVAAALCRGRRAVVACRSGASTAGTLDRAIGHVVELQRSDSSFGVWSDSGDTVPWLDAYAADFLIRAREHGKNVPDYAIKSAVAWLHDYVRQDHTEIAELPAVAYAHYVLARAKSDDLEPCATSTTRKWRGCPPSSPKPRWPRHSRNMATPRAPRRHMMRHSKPGRRGRRGSAMWTMAASCATARPYSPLPRPIPATARD